MRRTLHLICLCIATAAVHAADPEPDWDALEAQHSAAAVNEGALEFLAQRPAGRILATRNSLTITSDSLQTGWVRLAQCQSGLDPIDSITVMYRYTGMRGLHVVSAHNMDSAVVEANTLQLGGVRDGGAVCIEADVQVLNPDDRGGYHLRSGPFYRRFLDGYYPAELSYRVTWPGGLMSLREVRPAAQPGIAVETTPGRLSVDALFEGKLTIELAFDSL